MKAKIKFRLKDKNIQALLDASLPKFNKKFQVACSYWFREVIPPEEVYVYGRINKCRWSVTIPLDDIEPYSEEKK